MEEVWEYEFACFKLLIAIFVGMGDDAGLPTGELHPKDHLAYWVQLPKTGPNDPVFNFGLDRDASNVQ